MSFSKSKSEMLLRKSRAFKLLVTSALTVLGVSLFISVVAYTFASTQNWPAASLLGAFLGFTTLGLGVQLLRKLEAMLSMQYAAPFWIEAYPQIIKIHGEIRAKHWAKTLTKLSNLISSENTQVVANARKYNCAIALIPIENERRSAQS